MTNKKTILTKEISKEDNKFYIHLLNTTLKVKLKKNGKYKIKNIGKHKCMIHFIIYTSRFNVTEKFVSNLKNKKYFTEYDIEVGKKDKYRKITGIFEIKPGNTRTLSKKNFKALTETLQFPIEL